MQRLLTALAVVALSLSFIPGASAQITGTIAGTVRDSSGAVLSGASVTVRGGNLPTDGRKATTSDEGTYRFASLPPGRYEVSAESAGFGRQTKRGVEVAIDADTRVEFGLSPAGVEEAVDVVSSAPVIDVERSAVANRITQQTIDSLPLNGREFVDLVRLVPGATPVSGDQQGGALDQVSVFGERASATSYLVDGGNNNDPLNGGPFIRYTQDSIQEFEVITTGYEAQFGRAQGGVANIVTRSGSNLFQGSAFLFARNDSFDSSNVPDQDPPKLSRYQYGASLGGPIKKDKAFFFGTFELLDEKRGVNINQATIPDFVKSGIATPGGAEDFGIAPKTDRFNGMLKFDYNLNSNNRLFLQLNRSDEDRSGAISSPVSGTVALPSAAADATRKANSGILRHTAILSPQVFLESSATFIKGKVGQNLDRTERAEPLLLLLASGFLQTGGAVRRHQRAQHPQLRAGAEPLVGEERLRRQPRAEGRLGLEQRGGGRLRQRRQRRRVLRRFPLADRGRRQCRALPAPRLPAVGGALLPRVPGPGPDARRGHQGQDLGRFRPGPPQGQRPPHA